MGTEKLNLQLFAWKGINRQGELIKGMLPAETIESAEMQLHSQGIEISALKLRPKWLTSGKFKKIKTADIVIFSRQMATMVIAGIPLVQALEIVANGIDNLNMRAVILTVHKDVTSGSTFADALSQHPRQFSYLMCSLIKTGEDSGTLDIILNQISDYMERAEVLKGRIKKALMYPVVILVVTVAIAALLLTFIVPQFQVLFQSFGAELPLPTQVVINLSNVLQAYWALLLGSLVGAISFFILLKRRSSQFRDFLDKLALKMMLFGPLVRKAIIARIAKTMSITLHAGIPLVDVLFCASDVADNAVYRKAMLEVREEVISGKQLFTSLEATHLFPSMLLQMISVGEKSGALEEMLRKVAEYFDEQVNTAIEGLSTLIEPIMLVVLGFVVGGFVISMYLPIFRLGTVI